MASHRQPGLSTDGPPPLTPALSTSVILKLLSMTTTLSSRQPAASSSAWVLQRRSLNIWTKGDRIKGSSACPLAVPTLDLYPLTSCLFSHTSLA